jgi:hypothetical protein
MPSGHEPLDGDEGETVHGPGNESSTQRVSATVLFPNVPCTSVTTTPAACVGVVVIQSRPDARAGKK